ncbi:putative HTH-type transcriptional regulator [Aliiroseovarius pelagivivens]|uniref:Putative HTH-type transcriptional regulator n=1 Tax=Aliiroseovarius pelagivivens TaxID=1639690 RepID=A0A2R8AJF2_9RHOB|nr:helix-turn-helix domain-containing protein [Aliiroseovarius pelagivivens]SPF75994.1 putative HTH-type transcriptional regulator [Aliiroseovarius pelagivivens]
MKKYGQFCPIAKATEILGDSWSILIVRELLLGSSRFSSLQKGLPRISPTVLNTRLKDLEASGILIKRPISGQRGHDYRLTAAGKELSSVVDALAVWGMRWARDEMDDDDWDVTFLMFDVQRNIVLDELPDGETVICFQYPDLDEFGTWWLVCTKNDIDLCYQDPGKDVNAYVTAQSRLMTEVWMGDVSLSAALKDERIKLFGENAVCRRFSKWFPLSEAAVVPRPEVSR